MQLSTPNNKQKSNNASLSQMQFHNKSEYNKTHICLLLNNIIITWIEKKRIPGFNNSLSPHRFLNAQRRLPPAAPHRFLNAQRRLPPAAPHHFFNAQHRLSSAAPHRFLQLLCGNPACKRTTAALIRGFLPLMLLGRSRLLPRICS
ncbi:MAG: hypothetical protein ACOX41_01095 [Anaerovoracaceae bacterium]|jgi:hypothetical protein